VFLISHVLDKVGAPTGNSLAKRVSAMDSDDYASFISGCEAGPTESDDDLEDDDDDLEDDDDEEAPTVEAVKTALRAYSKSTGREEAKAIMNKNGADKLSEVDKCNESQLIAMFKAVT